MTGYVTRHVPTPPILAIEDGQLVVKVIDGDLTLVASVGDGSWFFHQVVDKLVDPALRQRAHDLRARSHVEGAVVASDGDLVFRGPYDARPEGERLCP